MKAPPLIEVVIGATCPARQLDVASLSSGSSGGRAKAPASWAAAPARAAGGGATPRRPRGPRGSPALGLRLGSSLASAAAFATRRALARPGPREGRRLPERNLAQPSWTKKAAARSVVRKGITWETPGAVGLGRRRSSAFTWRRARASRATPTSSGPRGPARAAIACHEWLERAGFGPRGGGQLLGLQRRGRADHRAPGGHMPRLGRHAGGAGLLRDWRMGRPSICGSTDKARAVAADARPRGDNVLGVGDWFAGEVARRPPPFQSARPVGPSRRPPSRGGGGARQPSSWARPRVRSRSWTCRRRWIDCAGSGRRCSRMALAASQARRRRT